MTTPRLQREKRRQLGQFFTPLPMAQEIIRAINPPPNGRMLEPSFGGGAFVFALLEALRPENPTQWVEKHLDGCEIDPAIHRQFIQEWQQRYNQPPPHTLRCQDFFQWQPSAPEGYDLIIGNPPFGGSFNPALASQLEDAYGRRNGEKIKKESYAFFLVRCAEMLNSQGTLAFICSDSILTLNTLKGLRRYLESQGDITIQHLPSEFHGVMQKMVLLILKKHPTAGRLLVFGEELPTGNANPTPNHSWKMPMDLLPYFGGHTISDYMTASAGLTTGDNQLFLREIHPGEIIYEPYDFTIAQQPITLEAARQNARNHRISPQREARIAAAEAQGATAPQLVAIKREQPLKIRLPHPDYALYNKSCPEILYAPPKWVIFWRNQGQHLTLAKANAPWHLQGMGGKKFYGQEGITWQFISHRLRPRYLPPGYIFDAGAPCAFLKADVPREQLFFILGWLLTRQCTRLLKEVLNHTRNIQGKDVERLPYPHWVTPEKQQLAAATLASWVERAGQESPADWYYREADFLEELYRLP